MARSSAFFVAVVLMLGVSGVMSNRLRDRLTDNDRRETMKGRAEQVSESFTEIREALREKLNAEGPSAIKNNLTDAVVCDADSESAGTINATLNILSRQRAGIFETCEFKKTRSIDRYVKMCGIDCDEGATLELSATGILLSGPFDLGLFSACVPCTNMINKVINATCADEIESCDVIDELKDKIQELIAANDE